jgi:uncharacterized membrane protein YfcA
MKAQNQKIIFSVLFGLLLLASAYPFVIYFSAQPGSFWDKINISEWRFGLIGFTAEVINGALGMAYGLVTTTMLLSSGITLAYTTIIVHLLELFTAGTSGVIHYKLGNVNKKLLKMLIWSGVIGALIGAFLVYYLKQYSSSIRSVVSVYTLLLGLFIIYKTINKPIKGRKIKKILPLGFIAGFLDTVGGGGWGTIVSSTLIAGGRSPRFTIGTTILSRFFVAVISSVSLLLLIHFTDWSIIAWLVAGGILGSPLGPFLTKHIPVKPAMWLVAITIILLSMKQIFF